jgi:hypothetical protein
VPLGLVLLPSKSEAEPPAPRVRSWMVPRKRSVGGWYGRLGSRRTAEGAAAFMGSSLTPVRAKSKQAYEKVVTIEPLKGSIAVLL